MACMIRNEVFWGGGFRFLTDPETADIFAGPGARINFHVTLVAFGLMLAWFAALSVFFLKIRHSRWVWALTLTPLLVFVVNAINVYRFAWPVCNAF